MTWELVVFALVVVICAAAIWAKASFSVELYDGPWLIGNGKLQEKYLRWGADTGWTDDPHKALQMYRHCDAEAVAHDCEDAWRIIPLARAIEERNA